MIYFPSQFFSSFLSRNFCRKASIDLTVSLCAIHLFMPLLILGTLDLSMSLSTGSQKSEELLKLFEISQSESEACKAKTNTAPAAFLPSSFTWMCSLSKVLSLQLKLFSWCWLDLIFCCCCCCLLNHHTCFFCEVFSGLSSCSSVFNSLLKTRRLYRLYLVPSQLPPYVWVVVTWWGWGSAPLKAQSPGDGSLM